MGWRERDYSHSAANRLGRRGRSASTGWLPPPASLFLLAAHATAFALACGLAARGGSHWARALGLSTENASGLAVLSHPFATDSALQFALVVLGIWLLAGRIERAEGGPRVLALYFVGNLAAGAAYWLTLRAWPAACGVPLAGPVGALAAWTVETCRRLGYAEIVLVGRAFSLRTAVLVAAAIAVAVTISGRGVGSLGWLGALSAGSVATLALDYVPEPAAGSTRRSAMRRARARPAAGELPDEMGDWDNADIDDILAKISREGLEQLSPDERERLEAARRAMLRKSR